MPSSITQQLFNSDVAASIALIAILAALHLMFGRALRRREDLTAPIARRWSANVRNFLLLVALIGLVMIWAPQLRTFALSLTAFAVAVVVAMKELILCLSGSALRTFTRAYSVGDHIELGGTRGEVLDHNLLVTKLAEFEKRDGSVLATGRQVILPHSLLFGTPLRVEVLAGGKLKHSVLMTFEPRKNLFVVRNEIRSVVVAALRAGESTGVGATVLAEHVEVGLGTSDIGKHRVEVRFLAPPEFVGQVEQAVICAVGNLVHGMEEERGVAGKLPVEAGGASPPAGGT
ncbi:mechanosensitive ion channel domain-containing protein [Croceicoccus bisphenolivorans]|uniref:mechanosensitive ion channel domain-containing protein n=1 Tax=Croceicoccus bisphenolivorans TaxID=1783232 RepID=UPI0008317979|nr:mechanosensitive ion channel domain-containing protein [Croceicoccus bisphenolivorans]